MDDELKSAFKMILERLDNIEDEAVQSECDIENKSSFNLRIFKKILTRIKAVEKRNVALDAENKALKNEISNLNNNHTNNDENIKSLFGNSKKHRKDIDEMKVSVSDLAELKKFIYEVEENRKADVLELREKVRSQNDRVNISLEGVGETVDTVNNEVEKWNELVHLSKEINHKSDVFYELHNRNMFNINNILISIYNEFRASRKWKKAHPDNLINPHFNNYGLIMDEERAILANKAMQNMIEEEGALYRSGLNQPEPLQLE